MFCEKCGAEIDGNEKTCAKCGAELEVTLDSSLPAEKETETIDDLRENVMHNNIPEAKKQKKFPGKVPVVIGIIAALILISSIAIFAMKSDMFKSPKDLYLEVEGDNAMSAVNKLVDNAEKNYDKALALKDKEASENKVELTGNVDLSTLPGIDSSVSSTINELLKSLKVVIDSKSNPKEKQGLYDFDIFIKGNKLLNGQLVQNNGKLALTVPVLYSKYIVFDSQDMNNLMSGLGAAGAGSIKPLSGKDIMKAIKFDKGDFIKLLKSYGKVLSNSIDSKQVTLEKNVDFKVNDLSIKCSKLTVSMDEKSFENMILSLLEKAQNDDLLYSMTAENVLNILKLCKDSGYPVENLSEVETQLSKDNFNKGISELKKAVEDGFKSISMPDGIKMNLYVDGHTIIGRTIETKIKDSKTNETVNLSIDYNGVSDYKNRNIFNLEAKVSGDAVKSSDSFSDFKEMSLKVNYDTTINKDIEKGKLKIVAGAKGDNFSANVFDADIGLNIDRTDGPGKYSFDYNINAGIPMSGDINVKGKLTVNGWEKEKEKKNGSDISFNVELKSLQTPDEKFSGTLNLKTESTKDIEFKLPDINSNNSVNIAKADQMELYSIYTEVMESIQKLAENNPDLMKMFANQY